MRATYFQLHQAHNALRIWGTLGQDCQILKYCLICLHMKFCTFCGMGTGRLQLPFAVPFCGMTSYGLMGWNRALQKNKFSGSDFFCTCLDCFQSTQNWYVDRTGSFLRDVIVKGRRKETKKTTYWPYWQTPEVAQNKPPPQIELTIFRREDRRSNHCATGPLPPGAFLLSLWAGCKGLGFGLAPLPKASVAFWKQ